MTLVYTIPVIPMDFSPKFSKSGHNRNEPSRSLRYTIPRPPKP